MLVLASNSPRRRELLKKITDDFIIEVSNYNEERGALAPKEYAMDCAAKKAEGVYNRITAKTAADNDIDNKKNSLPGLTVLAADTIVVLHGKILGKPKDAAEAKQTLNALSNKKHSVITGVCIKTNSATLINHAESIVSFKKFTQNEIDEYIATGSPFDKAGAYGIQDPQIQSKVISVQGSEDNVVGLPVELVREMLLNVKCRI